MFKIEGVAAGLEVVGRLSILADDAPFLIEFREAKLRSYFPTFGLRFISGRSFREVSGEPGQTSYVRPWAGRISNFGSGGKRRQIGRLVAMRRDGWLAFLLGVDPLELRIGAILATPIGQDLASDDETPLDPESETK